MLVVVLGRTRSIFSLGSSFVLTSLEVITKRKKFLFLWTKSIERRLGALATNYSPQSRLSFWTVLVGWDSWWRWRRKTWKNSSKNSLASLEVFSKNLTVLSMTTIQKFFNLHWVWRIRDQLNGTSSWCMGYKTLLPNRNFSLEHLWLDEAQDGKSLQKESFGFTWSQKFID